MFSSKTRCEPREITSPEQRRLRNPEGDRSRRVWRGLRGQTQELRSRLRAEDPQQVGDAEKGGDGLFSGGERRFGLGRSKVRYYAIKLINYYCNLCEFQCLNSDVLYLSYLYLFCEN